VLDQGGTLTIDVTSEGDIGTIRIADTGPGMDEATISRLWEPFFSTKPQGLGTGLGLASCYGIVSSHRGTIDVVSAPGEGAVFTIHLPLHNPVIAQGQTPLSLAPGGVILVVDDDAIVRRATVSMLRRIGFRAEDASSGDEALERVLHDPTRWAAVLLDLVMPQKTGAETFRDLWALKPDLPVIISSGYAPDRFLEDEDRRRIAAILHKPFTLDRLRTTLQSVGLTPPEAA
jgi:two-component system, cell cycle sensor histidine kinase and response regulator CckA